MQEDMNKYNTSTVKVPSHRTEGELSKTVGPTLGSVGIMLWKVVKTLFWVGLISGILVFLSVVSIVLSFKGTEPPNITDMSLNYSSYIYYQDENGKLHQHLPLYANEDRKWVALTDIPAVMQTAQIAIEDHRFYEHEGVDWKGTLGAVYRLFTNDEGRGGSTLTQQLIKNVTDQNQVSILRKIREIFMALNLEGGYTDAQGVEHKGFSKAEILQAYLNIVNYGGQCQGVQAAANHYFDKDISKCSLAECALIAGITQNPWEFNPIIFPENAKKRAAVVLDRMLELSTGGEGSEDFTDPRLVKITQSEYDAAIRELKTMTFVGAEISDDNAVNEKNEAETWNWYDDLMFEDVVTDLAERYNYSYDWAVSRMYNAGYKIVTAQDVAFQRDIENFFLTNTEMLNSDEAVELGFFMMDPYTGRVMAVIGGRGEKRGRRVFSNATDATRQSGSSIKPLSVYSVGVMTGAIDYSYVLKDQPLPQYSMDGVNYPRNFDGRYEEYMDVSLAIEKSQNAPAAWLCQTVSPEACYDWLVNKLHFSTLTDEDSHSISAMALGGQTNGVTVKDMTAGFQIFVNGGIYNKPITYLYVEDHDGNVILDNRERVGEQVMGLEEATLMNKLLHCPVYGTKDPTAWQMTQLPVEVIGKTGTTDSGNDIWFMGATPFCVAGIWNGYEYPSELYSTSSAKNTWQAVIQHVIDNYDMSGKSWVLSSDLEEHRFCRNSGKLAGPHCYETAQGWYITGRSPGTCNGGTDHLFGKKVSPSPSVAPSVAPSAVPSAAPSVVPSAGPSAAPSIQPTPTAGPTAEPTGEPTPAPPIGPEETPTPEPPGPLETPEPGLEETPTPPPFIPDVPPGGGDEPVG